MYYLEMDAGEPVFPQLMLFRTPLAPLLFGTPLDLGGPGAAEAVMGICYVSSILAVYSVGSFWSRGIGLGAALALLLYPAYAALYHEVSSDGPFAFGIAIWAAFITATAASPTSWRFAAHGVAVFLLVMIRPSAVIFLPLFAAFPFLLRAPMRVRLRNAGAFLATAVVLLLGWSIYNGVRYGDFALSRMSAAQWPLYRVLSVDRLVDPQNGPASRELARAIRSDLLTREPYLSYDIDLDEFLHTGRIQMWSDLAGLSDRVWGWDSDYGKLRAVALEAIAESPRKYARGVWKTVWEEMSELYTPRAPRTPAPYHTIECGRFSCAGRGFVKVHGKWLPEPWDKAEPIPRGHAYWLQSTPDGSISSDWSSLAFPRFKFDNREAEQRYERLSDDLSELMSRLPPRDGWHAMAGRLNSITKLYPAMLVWVLVGAVGLLFRPQRQTRVLVFLCLLGLAVVVGTAMGSPSSARYRLSVDPLFIVFGVAGLLGADRGRESLAATVLRRLRRRARLPRSGRRKW
jgi:hypothetical protein